MSKEISAQRAVLAGQIKLVHDMQWSEAAAAPAVDRYVHSVMARRVRKLGLDQAAYVGEGRLQVPEPDGSWRPATPAELEVNLPDKAFRLAAAFRAEGVPETRLKQVMGLMLRSPPPALSSAISCGSAPRRRWSCLKPFRGDMMLKPRVVETLASWRVYWTVQQSRIAQKRHHLFNDGHVGGANFEIELDVQGGNIEIVFTHWAAAGAAPILLTVGELGVLRQPMGAQTTLPAGEASPVTRHTLRFAGAMPADLFVIVEGRPSPSGHT